MNRAELERFSGQTASALLFSLSNRSSKPFIAVLCFSQFDLCCLHESHARMSIVRKVFPSSPARLPLSAAVQVGATLYVSGQLGVDPTTKQLVSGGIEAECRQALENIGTVLKTAGVSFNNVVKTTVLLDDINDFTAMNKVYQEFFQEGKYPARAAYQVAKLPIPGAKVEIEAIAVVGDLVEAKL